MKYTTLGNTGVIISRLGLGCIDFGTTIDESRAFELIDCYVQEGGNLLDTANNYAFWNGGDGRSSERVIGDYLSANPDIRKDIVLCTKLGALPTDLSKGFAAIQGNSEKVIYEEVEKSLEAMKTDYIDLLYLHVDDFKTDLEETMSALDHMIRKGYVRNIGCSNFYTWRIHEARKICEKNGYAFFCAVQQRNSYFKPTIDADFDVQIAAGNELQNYLETYNDLTFVSYSSLLHGMYVRGEIDDERYRTFENQKRMNEMKASGKNPNAFVLQQIIDSGSRNVALFTSSSVEHLRDNIHCD